MGQFRKKPVVVEARQVDAMDYDGLCALISWCGGIAVGHDDESYDGALFVIPTLEGLMKAMNGDWIIQGVAGEFYPCKPEIFEATYSDDRLMDGDEDTETIEVVISPFEALVEEGLLWLINTQVFHPRGYAMALHYSNGRIVGWTLLGDGIEAWTFDQDLAKEKFEAVTRYFRERDPNRP